MSSSKRGNGKYPSKSYLSKIKGYKELVNSVGGTPFERNTLVEDVTKKIFEPGIYLIGELSEYEKDYTNIHQEGDKYNEYLEDYLFEINGVGKAMQGSRFANFNTCWGDGIYIDNLGNEYNVDRGSIGCISAREVILSDYSKVFLFPKPFTVNYDCHTGIIRFGNLFIDTDYSQIGNREIYFYDPSNTYEADHPRNKDKENIDIKTTIYHKVKNLYPKPKEKITFSLIKYIKNVENSKNNYGFKNTASKDLIIDIFEKIKTFENINEHKSKADLINYFENTKSRIKEWILELKKENLELKNDNHNNDDLYGRKARPLKIYFDENIFLQNIDIKRFEHIINTVINFLKNKKLESL